MSPDVLSLRHTMQTLIDENSVSLKTALKFQRAFDELELLREKITQAEAIVKSAAELDDRNIGDYDHSDYECPTCQIERDMPHAPGCVKASAQQYFRDSLRVVNGIEALLDSLTHAPAGDLPWIFLLRQEYSRNAGDCGHGRRDRFDLPIECDACYRKRLASELDKGSP